MRVNHRWSFLLMVAALAGCAGAPSEPNSAGSGEAAGRKYSIVIRRTGQPGVERHVSRSKESTKRYVVSKGAQPLKDTTEHSVMRFAGTETLVDAGGAGKPRKWRYVVERFTIEAAGKQKDLLPAGASIEQQLNDEESAYTVDGNAVQGEQATLLKDFFGSSGSQGSTKDDRIFGSKVPRAVGESWPIDADYAAKDLAASDMHAKSVTGQSRIVSVKMVDGIECLELESNVSVVNDPAASAEGFPEGSKVDSLTMDAQVIALLPVDEAKLMLSSSFTVKVKTKVRVPSPEGEVLVDGDITDVEIESRQP